MTKPAKKTAVKPVAAKAKPSKPAVKTKPVEKKVAKPAAKKPAVTVKKSVPKQVAKPTAKATTPPWEADKKSTVKPATPVKKVASKPVTKAPVKKPEPKVQVGKVAVPVLGHAPASQPAAVKPDMGVAFNKAPAPAAQVKRIPGTISAQELFARMNAMLR